ncbi:MAG: DUF1302 family protein [Pseudomonadota bacterium]
MMQFPARARFAPFSHAGHWPSWIALGAAAACMAPAGAAEFDTGNPELKVRWDNSVKYSGAVRVAARNPAVASANPSAANLDDGDNNFSRGLVSNRVDLLSEIDASYHGTMGLRLAGAAWYDTVYNRANDNASATVNTDAGLAATRQFPQATRDVMGRRAEVLDAFLYLKSDNSSEVPYTLRLGRHSLVLGESLFFGANGIAQAQQPTDLVKLLMVPGSQFKEIVRPVGQLSGQVTLPGGVLLGGYYQLQWQANRIPQSGSYLSSADFVGDGARSIMGPGGPMPVRVFDARNSGQGGVQLRFKGFNDNVEFGVYAARYHDKGPQNYINLSNGAWEEYFAEGVKTAGFSFSTVLGETNVAGEMSLRSNAPLVSDPQAGSGGGNGSDRPFYAVGRTAHLNLSAIMLMPRTSLWDGASLVAEAAWNRTLSVSANPGALADNTTRDALGVRAIFTPQYFQITPGVDLNLPLGIGYNPYGRSSSVFMFNGGSSKGGDLSIGLEADYNKRFKASLSYNRFLGKANSFLNVGGVHGQHLTFDQALADRNFLSFSLQTTF